MARTVVEGARFQPCMESFLGAAKGALAAQGEARSFEELWGLSGLAFQTQIHRTLAPVGLLPRRWDETYSHVMRRLGFECIAGLRDFFYTADDLRLLQGGWMGNIERHLESGCPAIAFGLHGPAFGIIYGFDDQTEEYLVSTFLDGMQDGPVGVQELGSQHPSCIFVLIPTGPLSSYDPRAAVRQALREALDQHRGEVRDGKGERVPIPEDLAAGPAAFEAWAEALEGGTVAPPWGSTWAAGYYVEARVHGAAFLRAAAREWFPAREAELERAAGHLAREAEFFARLAALLPRDRPEALDDPGVQAEGVVCLKAARDAHDKAMGALEDFLRQQP